MNFEISNIRIIEEENLKNFEFKKEISEVEAYGLEMALVKLLKDTNMSTDSAYIMVDMNTRHLEDCLDVLDGCLDILWIDSYEVLSVHLTESGIPVLKCLKEGVTSPYESEDSIYYATIG